MAGRYGLSSAVMTVVFALGYALGPLLGARQQRRPALRRYDGHRGGAGGPRRGVGRARPPGGTCPGHGFGPRAKGSRWAAPVSVLARGDAKGDSPCRSSRTTPSTGSSTRCSRRPDRPREEYRRLYSGLSTLRPSAFAARSALVDQAYLSQGITFDHGGREQPFPFDLLPRLIPANEWERLEAGLAQRVRALDLFVGDLYGERRSIADGVVPNALVSTCEGYVRAMVGRGAAARAVRARVGHRPRPRRRRHLAGAGGQPALPVRPVVRRPEPGLHAPRLPGGLRRPPRRAGRPRALPAAVGADGRRPGGPRVAPGGGAHPRAGERRLLRARLPGPADGRGPGGGARPDRARPARVPAHHRGPRAGGRHLPAHRRRLPRPGGPALRLAARRAPG